MGLFEYLMVLVSVVIGLGVTEILTGAANLIRVRDEVRFYWIHGAFQVGVFFALLQQWWEFWDLEGVGTISFVAVLAILIPPIILVLVAHLLYPRHASPVDLEAYYFRQSPILWSLVIAGTVEGTFLQPLIFGDPILHPANLSGIPMVALSLVLALTRSRRVHTVIGPCIILMVILDTILANPAIAAR